MFSFFRPKDRWKWDPAKGVPDKKVLKLQRQALRSGTNDTKQDVLEHIAELAKTSEELKGALCDAKVTADVCKCFLTEPPMVQLAAEAALQALCHMHPPNCAATVATRQVGPHGTQQQPLTHALKLVLSYDKNLDLATGAAGLMDMLAASEPAAVTQVLLQHGGVSGLLAVVRACSAASLTAATPAARSARLLELLLQLLGLLQTAAAGGGTPMYRELGRPQGLRLLLDLTRDHRGQAPPPEDGQGGEGCGGHAAVVRDALSLLVDIISQVPAHRLPLLEADGVRYLLAVLRDLQLPWSVRLRAVEALQAAASCKEVATELVKARVLEVVFALVQAFVHDMQPGATGPAVTPIRGGIAAEPAGPTSAAASPAGSLFGSPMPGGGAAERPGEPRVVIVVEELLGLIDAVAGSREAAAVLEGRRLDTLLAALNGGMDNFRESYRMATASAQVLFRASRQPTLPQPTPLSGANVTGPLVALVDRALTFAAAATAKQAQIVHGGWCAAGLLCQLMDAERRRSRSHDVLLRSEALTKSVRLLGATAPALLVAVGAVPPPDAAAAASAPIWQTPGAAPVEGIQADGLVYLANERVVSDLRDAASGLLGLLVSLAEQVANHPAMKQMEAAGAARQLLPWRHVQWSVKRLLHLMGELDAEYKPFIKYSSSQLAALLVSQGVVAEPFLARRVDVNILLGLDDDYLKRSMGLDEVEVRKVARIRAAYSLFAAIDGAHGRADGCINAADVEAYLASTANMRPEPAADLASSLFQDLQVVPPEPICFMQFVSSYPWLQGELQGFVPLRTAGAAGGAAGAAEDGYAHRAGKRQRIGGGNGSGATPPPGQGAGTSVIELE